MYDIECQVCRGLVVSVRAGRCNSSLNKSISLSPPSLLPALSFREGLYLIVDRTKYLQKAILTAVLKFN